MTTQQAPVPVNIGDVLLGKYVVERVIGAGGMGVVVAVRHRDLGELYAMKFMLPAALENEQAVERFVREARAAAKLKSEHVASVTDVGRLENGSPYMVMDHLVGQDLEGVLAQAPNHYLPVHIAAIYVMQACDAIAEAHDAGIVHRDLKPANLFLTARPNGSPCIKVLDFGISKTVDTSENNSMTRTTAIMGSPYYMSPEQMRSSKNVDHRTDIWALGVILYQLSTGRVPFPGETITEVCSGVLADDVAPLHTVLAGIPPEFDGIVRRCLQKQPGMRFGSARELAQALAPVAGVSPGTSGLNLQIAGMMPGGAVQRAPSNPTIAMGPVGASGLSQSQNRPGASMAQSGSQPGAPNAITGGNQTQAQWGTTQPTHKKKSAVVPVLLGLGLIGGLAAGAFVILNNNSGKGAANSSKTGTVAPAQTSAETAKSEAVAVVTIASAEPIKAIEPPPSASSPVAQASSAPSSQPSASQSVAAAEPSAAKSSEKKVTSGTGGSRPTPVKTVIIPTATAANPPPTSTKPTIY